MARAARPEGARAGNSISSHNTRLPTRAGSKVAAVADANLEPVGEGLIDVGDGTPEDLYRLFGERGWGDGLPVVPPTEERVEATLAAGAGDPAEVLATLPPRFGQATRRAVATNAVLAGCLPETFPVLVTAVRALGRAELNLRGVNATTHPVAPLLIVHGAAADLGFNKGLGAFGPGRRANATVGRALRLVLLHVAGARPGDGDASTQGQPSKYTYCIAENLPASPWEGYAKSRGVDSPGAVTIFAGEGPHNFHDMESDRPGRILDKAASAAASLGANNACISQGEVFVVLCPEHAATIAGAGWDRRDVQSYLFEASRLPAGRLRAAFDLRAWRPWMHEVDDAARLPITEHPDNFRVLVAGGPGKHSSVIPSWGMTRSVTMALEP